MSRTLVLLACLTFVAACGEGNARPPPGSSGSANPPPIGGGSSSGDGGGSSSGGTDGGACTDLPNTGIVVDLIGITGDPPVGTGGPISDGVYDMIEARVYVGTGVGGATGATVRSSIEISGGTMLEMVRVITLATGGGTEVIETGTTAAAGTSFSFFITCPRTQTRQYSFTSVGNNLTITDLVLKEQYLYVKR